MSKDTRPATERQLRLLAHFGEADVFARGITLMQASRLIGEHIVAERKAKYSLKGDKVGNRG